MVWTKHLPPLYRIWKTTAFWFVGGDVASQIASAIGALPLALKEPAFYVPIRRFLG